MGIRVKLLFGFILVSMLAVTGWASLQEDVFTGGAHMLQYRWGWATLADAYFGFLTFYVWVFYRERALVARVSWFVAIMALGNIAMSTYVLWQLFKRRPLFGVQA